MNHHQFTVSVTSTLNPAIQYFHKMMMNHQTLVVVNYGWGFLDACVNFPRQETEQGTTPKLCQTCMLHTSNSCQFTFIQHKPVQEITQVLSGFKTTARSDNFRCWCCWRKISCAALAVQYLSISTHISSFLSLQKQTKKQTSMLKMSGKNCIHAKTSLKKCPRMLSAIFFLPSPKTISSPLTMLQY